MPHKRSRECAQVAVVLPAGGSGQRFGGRLPKQFQRLRGRPIANRTVDFFRSCPEVKEIVVVVPVGQLQAIERCFHRQPSGPPVRVVAGGAVRQESVLNGLLALRDNCRWVAVHDIVRPLLSRQLWQDLLRVVRRHGAVVPGLPVTDTLKRIDCHGQVLETVPREALVQVQTPQLFRRRLLLQASRQAQAEGFLGTDEAMLVERLGHPVHVVSGSPRNMKITVPGDLQLAAWMLQHPAWKRS